MPSTRHANSARTPRAAPAHPLTTARVWREVERASFAVLSCLTPAGAPRSTGVVYAVLDRRLYVVVAADSWKARHLAADARVALTVPVRRGGPLALLAPIPPATVSFHGTAVVHPPGTHPLPPRLASLVPVPRRDGGAVVEIRPVGSFLTYGLGVSLSGMRRPDLARRHVPVEERR